MADNELEINRANSEGEEASAVASASSSSAVTDAENKPSLEDYATREYQLLLPKFRNKLEELSNRQLKKVCQAMMEYPLERTEFQWSYPQEQELFVLGTKLMDCRFVIFKAALELKQDEIRELMKTPPQTEETVIVDKT